MSIIRGVSLNDGPQLDAFNRLRTSHPETIFAYSNFYDASPIFWEDDETGTGTAAHVADESAVKLQVLASGDKVIRQTRHYHPYQPGKSQLIKITFVFGSNQTNVEKHVGYFDADNGIFASQGSGGGRTITRRTNVTGSPVDTSITQASWNIDPMDGTGPSGITLLVANTQIFVIDLQWLGVGRVRCGWEIDGVLHYCHEFLNTNVLDKVYMSTATLPVRFEIEATGVPGATDDLITICASVDSEGGHDPHDLGIPFCAANGITSRSVSAQTALLSIRPKATFNSLVNRGFILPSKFGVATDGSGFYELVYNATIGGSPSWSSVNASSVMEFDIAGTTLTGGIVIDSGFITSGGGPTENTLDAIISSFLPLTLDIAGANPINMSVAYTPDTGSDSARAFLAWKEVR